ncbi:MAG TPA: ADOP family duplicated permease [Vicinamibacterales bacterium]|nr:ADOP family duplicated permease [Vicinamibacterales bacterium]
MLSNVTQDLRFAARMLWRSQGFSASAILILALGIAASTGLFAVIDALVLHPLPYVGAERIAAVRLVPPTGRPRPAVVGAAELRVLQITSTLDGAYVQGGFTRTLDGTSFPESVGIQEYSGNALPLLGVQPLLGRVFTEADAPIGSEPKRVAVLTYQYWQLRLGGRPDVVGQTLRLDGQPFTVIGVIPRRYADSPSIVVPVQMSPTADTTWPVTVRLKPGRSIAQAEAELQNVYEQFKRTRPAAYPPTFRVQLTPLVDEARGAEYVPVLALLLGAAAMLLLIGCANVTILLLARGRYRMREMAVRQALGAVRWRLVSLLLAETLLVTGAAAGVALLGVRYALPLLLAQIPNVAGAVGVLSQRVDRVAVGPTAILFATTVSALVSIIVGVWPALAVSRARSDAMRTASAVRGGAAAGRASSGVLIATQVMIAVVLLAGTGATIRALLELYRAPVGYDPTNVTMAQIHLQVGTYTDWPARAALFQRLRSEVASEPVVESASLSLIPIGPPPRSGMLTRIDVEGFPADDREVLVHPVSSDYLSTLKMPLVRGRAWSVADDGRAEPVAVINETMARQLWPHNDPIGKQVRDRTFLERRPQWILNAPGRDGWFTVIGVMRDAPNQGLREPVAPAMYYPYTAALSDIALLFVRTKGSPLAAEDRLRAAVARADGNLPIVRFLAPEGFMGRQQGEFVSVLLLGFSGIALVLASFGLFSVASYTIAQRTREFGIRIALGAAPRAVLRSALQPTMVAVSAGLGAGLLVSVGLSSLLVRWSIRNVDDPVVLVAAVGMLLLSTAIATLIPARRATEIEPTIALRVE